ncbi:MAG TPA: phospholipase D family protein [Prosthecobacter sp.]
MKPSTRSWTVLLLQPLLLATLPCCHTSQKRTPAAVASLPTAGAADQRTVEQAHQQRTVVRRSSARFEIIPGSKEAYMARLAMVETARRTLDVQYFIWSDDIVGTVMADRLLAAADRGVKVRLLLDVTRGAQKDVRSAGLGSHPNIQVAFFNPATDLKGIFAGNPIPIIGEIDRMQSRMHNKIMIADNATVIGGGRNLGDDYYGIHPKHNMRDLDFIATGPVVRDAAKSFALYWVSPLTHHETPAEMTDAARQELRARLARRKEELTSKGGSPYPTHLSPAQAHSVLAKVTAGMVPASYEFVADPPERMLKTQRTASPVSQVVEQAIHRAKKEILIHEAYFIPQDAELEMLRAAVARGVRVRVLTNSLASIDGNPAMSGIAGRRADILRSGVALHELNENAPSRSTYIHLAQPTELSMHTKAVLVDDHLSFIGSYNMDPRSKFINTETGVVIDSPAVAARLRQYLEEDLQPSNSWRVERRPAPLGGVRWIGEGPDRQPVVRRSPPDAPLSSRVKCFFLRCLPVEGVL